MTHMLFVMREAVWVVVVVVDEDIVRVAGLQLSMSGSGFSVSVSSVDSSIFF